MPVMRLPLTGDEAADRLLEEDPLALLIGMLLDQQVTMEKAFHSPYELKERLGGRLDAAEIAAMDPDKLRAVFADRPALHRFPGSMAERTLELCKALVEHYDGRAERVWETAKDGTELHARNFLDCVKTRKPTITPVETAHHSAIPGHLGLISMLVGRKIKWDANKEKIIGDKEAAKLLTRDYRRPWHLA